MKKKNYNDEIGNLIKITAVLVGVFVLFLVITIIVTNKKQELVIKTPTYTNEIGFEEILVGDILNRPSTEYYVLAYDSEDIDYNLYSAYLDEYNNKTTIKKYEVVLDRVFNKTSVAETSDFTNGIKFSGATLLKIKDKQIVGVYEGKEEIITYLKEKVK